MNSKWLRTVSIFTIGWIISSLIWEIIRGVSVNSHLELIDIDLPTLTVLPIFFLIFISLFAGLTFGSAQYLNESSITKKTSFRELIFRGVLIHILVMLIIYLLIYLYISINELYSILSFTDFLKNPITIINLFYSIATNSIIVIIIQINKLLGDGNLIKLITGRFYNPREELRVFMFLDLKSSTSIAENLGHIKYSSFIQDCFFDLSVVEKHKAEVYQYVGDEVVLTWRIKKNQSIAHCLKAYYAFSNQLKLRSEYYQTTYGTIPYFKAGMDLGMVTVVEVGSLKREIAYHGDTLNIAARIQEQCNIQNTPFMISGATYEYVCNVKGYIFENIEEQKLRGKENYTSMYKVLKKR